jgi:L-glutamine-phosphate cytidylyltransferase
MRGIIIAAGRGMRMRPLTEEQPKCLLPVAGRTLLDWTIDGLRGVGCDEIVVITGHAGDAIARNDITRVRNEDFENNNILHSLMCARDYLDGGCMVSYSDIWVEPAIHQQLANAPGDITIAADIDWEPYYEGRTEHPLDEAETVFLSPSDGRVTAIGKYLHPSDAGANICGEFLGLWKMTATGAQHFRDTFDAIDASTAPTMPFQHAKEWQKAYITDILQHMVDAGSSVEAVQIKRGWAELDTQQDYDRLMRIAARQDMTVLVEWQRNAGEAS